MEEGVSVARYQMTSHQNAFLNNVEVMKLVREKQIAPSQAGRSTPVVLQAARDFAAVMSETPEFQAVEQAGYAFRKDAAAQQALAQGAELPVVFVNQEVLSRGGKVSITAIRRYLENQWKDLF